MDSKCHNTECKRHEPDDTSNCKDWFAPKDVCKAFMKLSDALEAAKGLLEEEK